jgi:hypothetical protein
LEEVQSLTENRSFVVSFDPEPLCGRTSVGHAELDRVHVTRMQWRTTPAYAQSDFSARHAAPLRDAERPVFQARKTKGFA